MICYETFRLCLYFYKLIVQAWSNLTPESMQAKNKSNLSLFYLVSKIYLTVRIALLGLKSSQGANMVER